MANVKFTDLPNLGNITATTIVPVVSANVNYTITAANLVTYVNTNSGTITANNVSAVGNITAGAYFVGDGSQLTNLPQNYSNANVQAYLPTYSGTITAAVVSASGNITGAYLFGNGSQLTGIPASYGNANVATYLPTYTGNLAGGNVSVSGNVTGSFILGDGSQLTNLPGSTYGNSNVVTLLAGFGSNAITTTGNIQATAFVGDGSQLTNLPAGVLSGNLTGNISGNGFGITGVTTLTSTGLISTTGNITGANITGTVFGNGANLTGIPTSIVAGPGISVSASTGVVTITNNNATVYGNANVAAFLSNFGSNSILTSGNIQSGNLICGGTSSLVGTVSTGSINAGGAINGTSMNMTGNVTVTGAAAGLRSAGFISAAGNVIVGGTANLGPYIERVASSVNTSTSFTPAMTAGPVQQVLANNNFTLNAPTGMTAGQSICLIISQDATGNRLMTPNAVYKFAYSVNTLSTIGNSIDVLSIFFDGTNYLCNLVKGYV